LLTATAASQDAFTGGVALVVLGSLAIPGGLLVTLTGAVQGLCIGSCPPNGGPGPDVALEVAGGVIAITGVVALVGGILLVHGNARSGQTQDILFPKPPEHQDTAWLRAPVWNDSVRAGPAGAARVGVPIFSRRF
jgi:hypothetical protein